VGLLTSLDQYEPAIAAFNRAIELQPSPRTCGFGASASPSWGGIRKPIVDGEAALNLQPDSRLAHMLLSGSYEAVSDKAAAEHHSALVGSWQ